MILFECLYGYPPFLSNSVNTPFLIHFIEGGLNVFAAPYHTAKDPQLENVAEIPVKATRLSRRRRFDATVAMRT